jgi:hypothetical protein
LFRDGVSLFEIQDTIKSLDESFLSLSGIFNIEEESNAENPELVKTPPMRTTRHEAWGCFYKVYETQETGSTTRSQCPEPTQQHEAVLGAGTREVSQPKRRKRTSLGFTRDDEKKRLRYYKSE